MMDRDYNKDSILNHDTESGMKDSNIVLDKVAAVNNVEELKEFDDTLMDSNKVFNSKDERRRQRREKRIKDLKESRSFWLISTITKWADKYFLDALLGFIPSVGDVISSIFGLPFIYLSV